MLKLREPFSQKIHLHIRQNMLQRLWDKYVPQSSAAYGQIQLVYLKNMLGELEEQPKQVKLLLWLLLKNKIMQINLMQNPTLVKVGQKQMERRLRQIERFYGAQLKSCDFTMFRTVKQYFALLEQAQENSRRYQGWQNSYREIEKQREESRLLSLFSVKLQELVTKHSERALRTMEQEFISSLSKTEYRTLSEEMIWGEKTELISYLRACDTAQCEKIINVLEREVGDSRTREALEVVFEQPVKEELIAAVERLEQKEFCLLYHQVTELEDVASQMVVWKEKQSEMVQSIDRLETVLLQQMWEQVEEMMRPLEQNIVQNTMQVWEKNVLEQNTVQLWGRDVSRQDVLRIQEKLTQFLNTDVLHIQETDITGTDVTEQASLQTLERELVYSLSDTQYQTLSEELIWQEKPELISYLRECSTAQSERIISALKNDVWDSRMREALQSVFEQPEKEKLIAAVERLEQKEFCLFYHRVEGLENISAQMVIWKEDKTEMLRTIDHLEQDMQQRIQNQVETVINSLQQVILRIQEKDSSEQNILHIQEKAARLFERKELQFQKNNVLEQNTLQAMEKELVDSMSETEYRTFTEELIWQEKPELISYLRECSAAQLEKIINVQENDVWDVQIREALQSVFEQPEKEKLIATVEQLEQKEFCLFYHHVMKAQEPEAADLQMASQIVLWKESRTEMLHEIDRLETSALQRIYHQIEAFRQSVSSDRLRVQENDVLEQDTLRIQEKERIYSLLETEYQTFAEELIWKEKPEFIAFLKECSKARCKEIVKELEKDIQMNAVLSSVQKQSVRKKLVGAGRKLKQAEFVRFYWQIVDMKYINPPLIVWKKNKREMLLTIDEMKPEHLQEVWAQMEAVPSVKGMKSVLSEKMLQLQNEYRKKEMQSVKEEISTVLEENALEHITDIVNIGQLLQDIGKAQEAGEIERAEKEPGDYTTESVDLVLWDGVSSVIRRLEQEQETRQKRVEQQQRQAVAVYQKAYQKIFNTEEFMTWQQENTEQLVEQTFLERHHQQEKLTREEMQNIREWSKAFLEIDVTKQEQPKMDNAHDMQENRTQLLRMIEQMNHYIEKQYGFEKIVELLTSENPQYIEEQYHFDFKEKLILNWQENLLKDERIQNALVSIQNLEEEQRQKFIQYMADMMMIRQEITLSGHELSSKGTDTTQLPDRAEYAEPFPHNISYISDIPSAQDNGYDFEERVLRTGDREFAAKLLQIEDKEFAGRLLNIGNKAFVEALLRIDDRTVIERLLRIDDREAVEQLLQENDIQQLDVPYAKLWEWGETLLFHPDNQPEWEDGDLISMERQETVSFDGAQQEDLQTQVIRQQIAMAKDRNYLQRLIRQINHQTDVELVYTDNQLRLPQVQILLQYIRELDEKQFGVLVKELAQITKIQKMPYEEVKVSETAQENVENKYSTPEPSETKMFVSERRTIPYPVLVQRIQEYEKQHTLKLYRDIANIEQRVFPQAYEKRRQRSVTYGLLSYEYDEAGQSDTIPSYQEAARAYGLAGLAFYEEAGTEYAQAALSEEAKKVSEQAFYEEQQSQNRYQPQKLEYSEQKAQSQDEEQQRKELRMQQETAQIKSVQEQLDKKLKEVEQQLKKVENSTKAKEDVGAFAEQVKRQLYEELHVEKLRRGLV